VLEIRHQAALDRLVAVLRAYCYGRSTLVEAQRPSFPELECLRGLLSEQTLLVACRRAGTLGLGADRVLVSAAMLDEELYVRALGDALGIMFEPLDSLSRRACPSDDRQFLDALAAGILPLIIDGDIKIVVAPQAVGSRTLARFVGEYPHMARRFRLTTSKRLQNFVSHYAETEVTDHATSLLAKTWPDLSAATTTDGQTRLTILAIAFALATALVVAPRSMIFGLDVVLSLLFLAWAGFRIIAAMAPLTFLPSTRLSDKDLPVYSVLVPLYREATSVKGLVAALRKLNYPAEKLDIKVIVERDDHETIAALERQRLPSQFDVVVAPAAGPRTKPKALNAALPSVRGSFVVVYDAEDRPEPDQLRRALDAFMKADERLACVQASLTIDNSADNWLTAMFTAEYAGQFDVFLPALSLFGIPLPLGGSSNHFRTAALRSVSAWDPYNVTEDADLGLRLARFGFRSTAIPAITYEEAPPKLGPWLRQRTRWFKGWMQTWLVHIRTPGRLLRELGLWRFAAVQLTFGGSVLASLVHPLMLAWLLAAAVLPEPIFGSTPAVNLFTITIVAGYGASVLLGAVGLYRRSLTAHAWVLLLVPLHWLLLAAASWRALYQLLNDPYRWEKTEHGLARSSRMVGANSTANVKPPQDVPAAASSAKI